MLIELEGHVLFAIKDEIGDEFHYIWSANILKIIGRHTEKINNNWKIQEFS
jgi:hypothetical protein